MAAKMAAVRTIYSNLVHTYPIEIMLVSIPRYSAALLLIMTLVRAEREGNGH